MNTTFFRVFRLALCSLFLAGFLVPTHDVRGAASAAQEPTPCLTCDGAGHAVLTCDPCEGEGKAVCRDCPRRRNGFPNSLRRAILLQLDPEVVAEEDKKLADTLKTLDELSRLFSSQTVNEVIPKGYIDCPGGCANGLIGTDKKYPCRYCKKKGQLKCPTCKKKGVATCPTCLGKKKKDVTCPECRGSGEGKSLSLLTRATAPICPWCSSEDLLPCLSCSGEGSAPGFCANCSGERVLFCRTCLGTEKKPCNRCRAAGKVKTFGFNGSHVTRCDPCKGSGILDCDKCQEGALPCSWCEGDLKKAVLCVDCFGTGSAPCLGCFEGRGRAWEVTAGRLEEQENWEVATAYYEEALILYRSYHRDLRVGYSGSEKELKKLKRKHERLERDLEKRAHAARTALEKQKE